jgi:hypothetical protein
MHEKAPSSFAANIRLLVHRWFRHRAGFSAEWAERTAGTSTGRLL